MVLALVLIPAFAELCGRHRRRPAPIPSSASSSGWSAATSASPGVVAVTVIKLAAFVGFMFIVGRRLIPMILHFTAHTGSRELFRLAVLAIALGVAAGSAYLFGVSLALGAFFAGMILSESELSHRAAQETLPLRDAFSVLFFVAVGMLFNPTVLITHPLPVLATLFIILFGKTIVGYFLIVAVPAAGGNRRSPSRPASRRSANSPSSSQRSASRSASCPRKAATSSSPARSSRSSSTPRCSGSSEFLRPRLEARFQPHGVPAAGAHRCPRRARAGGPGCGRAGARTAGGGRRARHRPHRPHHPCRLWPRRHGDRRGPDRRRHPLRPDRGRRGPGRRRPPRRHRGHRGQRRDLARAGPRQRRGRDDDHHRHPQRLRGRPGDRAEPQAQSQRSASSPAPIRTRRRATSPISAPMPWSWASARSASACSNCCTTSAPMSWPTASSTTDMPITTAVPNPRASGAACNNVAGRGGARRARRSSDEPLPVRQPADRGRRRGSDRGRGHRGPARRSMARRLRRSRPRSRPRTSRGFGMTSSRRTTPEAGEAEALGTAAGSRPIPQCRVIPAVVAAAADSAGQ